MFMIDYHGRRIFPAVTGEVVRRGNQGCVDDVFEIVLTHDQLRALKKRRQSVAFVKMRLRGDKLQQLERRQTTFFDYIRVESAKHFDLEVGFERVGKGRRTTKSFVETIQISVEALKIIEAAPDDDLDASVGILSWKPPMSHFIQSIFSFGMQPRLGDVEQTNLRLHLPHTRHLQIIEIPNLFESSS